MTIGVGFFCEDGILLAADNLVTWEGMHQYYECKLYPYSDKECQVVFTYAGNPDLMKMFDGKFKSTVSTDIKPPVTVAKIQNHIEAVLLNIAALTVPGELLRVLAGIVIPGKEFGLVKTDNLIVRPVTTFDYVGTGDSSVVRYLSPLMIRTRGYTAQQAKLIAAYLLWVAKRYVTGCGGNTDIVIMRPNGSRDNMINGGRVIELRLELLEHVAGLLASTFFDGRRSEQELDDYMVRLTRMLKSDRKDLTQ